MEGTSFIGRRREVREAKRLFSLTHLVTLIGVGGVGKTRLAQRLANDWQRAFRDGVYFVQLSDLLDPTLLGHTVAETLGLRELSRNWRIETLTDYLKSKQLLLVLDNCEHLLGACASLVDELLTCCADLRVLATSREPLGIAGESTLIVAPLQVPEPEWPSTAALAHYDSVKLFLDRAESAMPGFELTEQNSRTVAALCHSLDGLPLALELAAVRLRALSVEQILDRLSDRFALLSRGRRNAPTRQQTLRALIAWSYELCAPNEQLLWTRLSVFSGGIELDAAEGVCADDLLPRSDILELLASLVDKSIVVRDDVDGRARYRLLETIRQYGEEQLEESGERTTWRRFHRDWYLQLVTDVFSGWVGANQPERIERLRRDHANLRSALDYCVTDPDEAVAGLRMASTLYFYWLSTGFLSEGRHWLDLALRISSVDCEPRPHALYVAACLATLQDDPGAATKLLDQATTRIDETANQRDAAYIAQGRGLVAMFADDLPEAIRWLEEALAGFGAVGEVDGETFTFFLHGLAALLAGELDKVEASHARCRELTELRGESWVWSYSLWVASLNAWVRGDNDEALAKAFDCLRHKRALDDQLGIAECLEAIAWINASMRQRETSAVLLGAASTIWQRIGMSLRAIPGLDRFHQKCRRTASQLGERPYQAAFRRGAEMSLAEAVDFALGERTKRETGGTNRATDSVGLTRREMEVAQLIAEGLSNREIANQLVIARRTAEGHVEHVLAKLGFTSRAQVAGWVAERQRQASTTSS
ncbi:ATP-binding protein [Haloechinothrix salitolerans]|uniref:ATP-binding protein n=1 Tax=Haloechinothrix salitolerans TaxID=926830 RepID=A0ABW2BWJ1_9PSEU